MCIFIFKGKTWQWEKKSARWESDGVKTYGVSDRPIAAFKRINKSQVISDEGIKKVRYPISKASIPLVNKTKGGKFMTDFMSSSHIMPHIFLETQSCRRSWFMNDHNVKQATDSERPNTFPYLYYWMFLKNTHSFSSIWQFATTYWGYVT